MSKQRQVFPRETVAHLWAHKGQDSARDASQNFYFTGPTLYSYGSHFVIAHHLDESAGPELQNRILWNDASYSNTTSKMQHIARWALTSQQRENLIHLPSLTRDSARSISRALAEKKLPDVAEKMLNDIRDNIAALAGKRHDSGPFNACLYEANRLQIACKIFYARAGREYPMPDVPASADVPAEKKARDAFILTFSKARILADYKSAIAQACADYAYCLDAAGNSDASIYGHNIASSTYDRAQRCQNHAHSANQFYGRLHAGKKSAQANRILRDVAPMVQLFADRKLQAEKEYFLQSADRSVHGYFKKMHQARNPARGQDVARIRADIASTGYRIDTFVNQLKYFKLPAESIYFDVARRMARISHASQARRELDSLMGSIKSGHSSYDAGYFADAARDYRRIVSGFNALQNECNPKLINYLVGQSALSADVTTCQARLIDIDARIHAENAAKIQTWIDGQSNIRPSYDAGTYARINGANIETNRGATVPIAHACRLARIFDRIVASGGANWPDGTGPQVGHYRVNKIGADGSLIIGCHEFDAIEARRLRDILQACAECTETVKGQS